MLYFAAFALACLTVLLLTPIFSKIAHKIDYTDKPTERKKHAAPIPLVGGVVMFIAFSAGFIIFVASNDLKMLSVVAGAAMLIGIGLIDDYFKTKQKEFPVLPRVAVYLAVAAITFAAGIRFTGFHIPFAGEYCIFPLWLQFAITSLWIFGLITVANWMDGLDGLSGSLCALSGITLFIVAVFMGQSDSAFIAVILVGSTLGFLRYNLYPAKVYMGDSGANLLGYLLGVISLYGAFKQATLVSLAIPVLAMGVPIFDSIFVAVKRLVSRKPAHKGDHTHIHFRLTDAGLKPVQAVAFIVLISVCLNLASIIILLVME
ncbi:MAG: undecaprenyl/decaprenyl-phosphate alpha-N-acetylglucosaminyl 1-phosphate transferase [Defluviitaleaceae bacterium]|nr:undecaprenyl/decaprenyl-phosphate alpha-N-acetylglucosaminyl 1-phosphate transferase [Defluviitaleaceae bacterium]